MTLSDVAIFDKETSTTSFPNASSLVTAEAMILKKTCSYKQNCRLNVWEVSSNFLWGFSHKHGNHMGYIINNDVIFWTILHVAT